jgi:hypothetical protein
MFKMTDDSLFQCTCSVSQMDSPPQDQPPVQRQEQLLLQGGNDNRYFLQAVPHRIGPEIITVGKGL